MYKIVIHYPKSKPENIQLVSLSTYLNFIQHPKLKKNKATTEVMWLLEGTTTRILDGMVKNGLIISYKVKRLRSSNERFADKQAASAAKEFIHEL